jgi:chromosome segregation ATPase
MNARTTTITAIVLHLAACTPLEPVAQPNTPPPVPIIQARSSDTDLLLARFEVTRTFSKEELKAETASAQRRLATMPTPYARTELALLLSAPHAETRDLPQALKLLQDVIRDAQSSGALKNFASALHEHLTAAARQEENVSNLSQRVSAERKRADQLQTKQDGAAQQFEQKLKDEQKRLEAIINRQEENIQQLTGRLREEQKRADDLQEKLDAIMKIEKSLIERQQTKEAPPKEAAPKETPKESPKDIPREAPKEPK